MIPCIDHLREEDALGPVQRDEALFLFGLMRVLRPRVIVEFGYLQGDSARVLQEGSGGRVFSFDCNPDIPDCTIPGVTLVRKRQEDFEEADISGAIVDVVFFDAGHDLQSSIAAFNRVSPFLANWGMLIVHDTGTWLEPYMQPVHHAFDAPWISSREKAHRPDERRFVNWLTEEKGYSAGWSAVNFHSRNCLRHGLTVLQRTMPLPVPLPVALTTPRRTTCLYCNLTAPQHRLNCPAPNSL